MKSIIFYAPLGRNIPSYKCGGAESGCLKTLRVYQNNGFKVVILDKPARSQGTIKYLLGLALVPIKLLCLLVENKHSPMHLVGFYRNILLYEFFLYLLCKLCGHKVIYEIRNGSMIKSYEKGNSLYKKVLKVLLTKPDVVLCQGREYVNFIYGKWGIRQTYYPNYVPDDKLSRVERKREGALRLIYFGRVTSSKNVDICLGVVSRLKRKGIKAYLDVIGGFEVCYMDKLKAIVKNENISDRVSFYGRRDFDFITNKLKTTHYFIFPSNEDQEGHSNSLTEAMAFGVVPIVSNVGFNNSICGEPFLVVNSFDPKDYAEKIELIEKANNWELYSRKMVNRVVSTFTECIVGKVLIETVDKLYSRCD